MVAAVRVAACTIVHNEFVLYQSSALVLHVDHTVTA